MWWCKLLAICAVVDGHDGVGHGQVEHRLRCCAWMCIYLRWNGTLLAGCDFVTDGLGRVVEVSFLPSRTTEDGFSSRISRFYSNGWFLAVSHENSRRGNLNDDILVWGCYLLCRLMLLAGLIDRKVAQAWDLEKSAIRLRMEGQSETRVGSISLLWLPG